MTSEKIDFMRYPPCDARRNANKRKMSEYEVRMLTEGSILVRIETVDLGTPAWSSISQ
jgi:hypothetical protein